MIEARESPAVHTRAVLFVAAGILLFLIAFVAFVWLVFPDLVHRAPPVFARFPEPSVTTDERAQRLLLERSQKARLTGANGTMSIERAMADIAAKGMAAYDPVQGVAR